MNGSFLGQLVVFGTCLLLSVMPVYATSALEDRDLSNFHDVDNGILRGGQPSLEGMRKLAKRGVKTVVNLRMEGDAVRQEAQWCKDLGIEYDSIPMDQLHEPSHTAITTFLELLRNPEKQPVFVHCAMGEDRTGTMIAIYRIMEQGWTSAKAYKEMLKYGFHPMFMALADSVFDADEEKNGIAKPEGRPIQVKLRDAMERGLNQHDDDDDRMHKRLGSRMDLILM